jgi:hypothetical protein
MYFILLDIHGATDDKALTVGFRQMAILLMMLQKLLLFLELIMKKMIQLLTWHYSTGLI